jgi:hypothetical protein
MLEKGAGTNQVIRHLVTGRVLDQECPASLHAALKIMMRSIQVLSAQTTSTQRI